MTNACKINNSLNTRGRSPKSTGGGSIPQIPPSRHPRLYTTDTGTNTRALRTRTSHIQYSLNGRPGTRAGIYKTRTRPSASQITNARLPTLNSDLERDRTAARGHVVAEHGRDELGVPGAPPYGGRPGVRAAELGVVGFVAVPQVEPVVAFRSVIVDRRRRPQRCPGRERRSERGRRRVHRQETRGRRPVAAVRGHARVLARVAALSAVHNQLRQSVRVLRPVPATRTKQTMWVSKRTRSTRDGRDGRRGGKAYLAEEL